jgi:PleD family two-component response regulator
MRILIAEDSLTQAVDLRRRLEGFGHEVLVTYNGREAWERLSARRENLVISDWLMPEMSGLDLCRKVRAELRSPYVYLILLTAKTHRHERLQGLQAGADDFLGKPIENVELEIALKTARRILEAQEVLQARARDLERANAALTSRALLDEQTGLKNAQGFREDLATALRQSEGDGLPLSLIHLELVPEATAVDRDEPADWPAAVTRSAGILRDETRSCDAAGRTGELGFGVILRGLAEDEALMIGDLLRTRIDDAVRGCASAVAYVGVVSTYPDHPPAGPAVLMAAGEAALAQAIRGGAGRIAYRDFSPTMSRANAATNGFNPGR